jgi:hypothetical protein
MEELTGVDMIEMRQRKLTFAFLALAAIFAGCKSETPTTPSVNTGGTPGGVTPPNNATIVLAVSNASPLVNSNVIITATVTLNNQPVPNGTAVQFITSLGTFTDTGGTSTVRTTTNGVATATLTSATAGTAIVTATVNNASKQITVTFTSQPVTPPPPSTAPTISTVVPNTGKPQGGDVVTITGTNFNGPIRVLFDLGNGTVREAFVSSFTNNSITVVTPAIDLASGTTQAADVIVLTQAGTAAEQRVVKAQGFTFISSVLTPVVRALQPTSGPIGGGTRVTIIGDAFQQPVQVFFNAAEAQVISVTFNQIIVMSPRASDTAPGGSGVVTGLVDIKVRNISSNKEVTFPGGFRYIPKMQITTVHPTSGPFTGGTQITIDGTGFDDPLAVVIGNGANAVAAQVIRVSGTEVVAITGEINPTSCGDVPGTITVTNTENGDSADGPVFTFLVPRPLITAITPNPSPIGGTVNITVLHAIGFARITIGGVVANVTGSTVNSDGTTTFAVIVPNTVTLNTQACPGGGTAPIPTAFDVTYTSATTGCTDTSPKGLTVSPAQVPVLFTNPLTFTNFTAGITPATVGPPPTPATVAPSSPQNLFLVNNGTSPLDIQSVTKGAQPGCADFQVGPAIPPVITLNQCESIPITVVFTGQTTPGTETCTLTVTTSAGTRNFLLVGTSQ